MRTDIIQTRGYDPAIAGDELSLKIASYPATARYLAERLKGQGETLCELCCGIGVSLVELSRSFDKVIGVDIDQTILADCRKNLELANISNLELICGDISNHQLLERISADVVLYYIPYWSSHDGQVDPDKQNPDLKKLITDIREVLTDKIVIYAPTHMTYEQVTSVLGTCEFVKVYVNEKHDRNFIFLGGLVEHAGEHEVRMQS